MFGLFFLSTLVVTLTGRRSVGGGPNKVCKGKPIEPEWSERLQRVPGFHTCPGYRTTDTYPEGTRCREYRTLYPSGGRELKRSEGYD